MSILGPLVASMADTVGTGQLEKDRQPEIIPLLLSFCFALERDIVRKTLCRHTALSAASVVD